MYNFLKIILILLGAVVVFYGIYAIASPQFALSDAAVDVEAQENHIQSYAMIGFGVLLILAGLAFKKGR